MKKANYLFNKFDVANSLLIGILGSYSTLTMLNNIKKSDKLIHAILWIISTSISVSLFFVWPFHFLAVFAMDFDDFELYYRIDLTFYSLICGIFFTMLGLIFSYLPIIINLKRKYVKIYLNNEITFFEYIHSEINLIKKNNIFYLFLGSLFAGPGILVLHIVGMYSMVFPGTMDFNWKYQICICLFGIVGGFVLLLGFYYSNSLKFKLFFTVFNATGVFIIHFLSVYCTDFYFDSKIKINEKDSRLVNTKIFGNIIIVIIYSLNNITRELSHYWFRNNIGFLKYIEKILGKKKEAVGYLERIIEKIKKDDDKLETLKLIPRNRYNSNSKFSVVNSIMYYKK